MPDARRLTFVALSCVLLFGTIYSVAFHTYIDTSDPAIALARAPHPLAHSTYFARKDNLLNTLFIKKAWAWSSAAALALLLTAPPSSRAMTPQRRLAKWAAATAVWLAFTVWFFGPGVLARVLSLSGAECVVRSPGSGALLAVPPAYCAARTPVSPATHPELFLLLPLASAATSTQAEQADATTWTAVPRMARGHDVSGHVFLVTMSLLFLADMARPSLHRRLSSLSAAHRAALAATGALMLVWMLALFTTSLYFHTPFEKLTGYLVGLAGFLVTQLPPFQDPLPEILAVDSDQDDSKRD